jgi:hypothetical protein
MLVIVVAIFGLCWLPLHGLNMARDTNPEIMLFQSKHEYYVFLGLYLTAHWLAMSNSFTNPIIYGFTNESFRVSMNTNQDIIILPSSNTIQSKTQTVGTFLISNIYSN